MPVFFPAEVPKNVSPPWVSVLQALKGWGCLTMAFICKLVYIAHHFILLRLNPIGVRLDKVGLCFEHSV